MKNILSSHHNHPSSSLSSLKTLGAAALASIFSITTQAQDKEIYGATIWKIDYSGCGPLVSTGRNNCGKIVPIKIYYRSQSNKPLTEKEAESYLDRTVPVEKENINNGAKYVKIETNLGEKKIIPSKEMIVSPGKGISDNKKEVFNTTAQKK